MKYKNSFENIRIPLNNRLIRKIRNVIRAKIKKDNISKIDSYELIVLYNYLNRMWKHPNSSRFPYKKHNQLFNKRPRHRYLYVNWYWYATSSNKWVCVYADWSKMNIDMLINWILLKKHNANIPF